MVGTHVYKGVGYKGLGRVRKGPLFFGLLGTSLRVVLRAQIKVVVT